MQRHTITAGIGLAIVVLFGVYLYRSVTVEAVAGENDYRLANRQLADGASDTALRTFESAISKNSDYAPAYAGKAIALMQLKRAPEALESFNIALTIDPEFADAYANRGILHDRQGRHEAALKDYQRALSLKPDLGKGPGMIWRFLHSPGDKPATLAARADYIAQELNKPPEQRLLRLPDEDEKQKMYAK